MYNSVVCGSVEILIFIQLVKKVSKYYDWKVSPPLPLSATKRITTFCKGIQCYEWGVKSIDKEVSTVIYINYFHRCQINFIIMWFMVEKFILLCTLMCVVHLHVFFRALGMDSLRLYSKFIWGRNSPLSRLVRHMVYWRFQVHWSLKTDVGNDH